MYKNHTLVASIWNHKIYVVKRTNPESWYNGGVWLFYCFMTCMLSFMLIHCWYYKYIMYDNNIIYDYWFVYSIHGHDICNNLNFFKFNKIYSIWFIINYIIYIIIIYSIIIIYNACHCDIYTQQLIIIR